MISAEVKLKNGKIILPNRVYEGNIYVVGGKIVGIEDSSFGGAKAKITYDVNGMSVLPGLVDIHVHMRDPGFPDKEDFHTGTKAAAAGGFTTICDMPNNIPPVTSAEIFENKKKSIKQKAVVDYCLYGSASNVEAFDGFRKSGAIGVKLYMEKPIGKGSPYSTQLTVSDDGRLLEIFECAGELGIQVAVHLDTPGIREKVREKLESRGQNWGDFYDIENSIASEIAFDKVLAMAEKFKTRLHISHVPSYNCLKRIKEAKKMNKKVTADCVLPAIDLNTMVRLGAYATPFGRPERENEFFWECLKKSYLDCVITDHAPHTIEEKEKGRENIWSAPPGVPGLETSLGILLTRVNEGLMSIRELAGMASERPAKITNIYDQKGSIEIGKDADFVIVNMNKEWMVNNKELYTKCGWSPFDGRRLVGKAYMTILRGNIIMEDGKILAKPGIGNYIAPKLYFQ